MFKRLNARSKVKRVIAEERKRLLTGVDLAKTQWQMVQQHLEGDCHKYDVLNILERRYMFLLNVAKRRKIHAMIEG